MPTEGYVLLILAGLVAGIVNTLAGGGSLLTLPALIFLGLDANVANGTNRVGVLLQNVIAVGNFAGRGRMPWRDALALLPTALLGAVIGARVAVEVPSPILRAILAVVILLALPAVFMPEGRTAAPGTGPEERTRAQRRRLLLQFAFLGIGFYGGFIQAGVGFLILGALVPLAGYDLVRANALKLTLVLAYTAIALPVFIAHGQVNLMAGLILAAGQMAGGWIGSHLAMLRGARFVRWVLLVALVLSALELFGLPARIFQWIHG